MVVLERTSQVLRSWEDPCAGYAPLQKNVRKSHTTYHLNGSIDGRLIIMVLHLQLVTMMDQKYYCHQYCSPDGSLGKSRKVVPLCTSTALRLSAAGHKVCLT